MIWASKVTLEVPDGRETLWAWTTHEYHRLRPSEVDIATFSWKNQGLRVGGDLTPWALKVPSKSFIIDFHWKIMIWASKITLEVPDRRQTLWTWTTHEYHRLRASEVDPATFSWKKSRFLSYGGSHPLSPQSSLKVTYNRFPLKNHDLSFENPLRVVRLSPNFVGMDYPWVLSIGNVWTRSDKF